MRRQNCFNCIFSSWYDNFKHITFKSKVVKLTPAFVQYLNQDGVVLPDTEVITYADQLDRCSDGGEDWEDAAEVEMKAPQFPEIKREVETIIKAMNGSVFPKLNWSSPKDAVWISANNTLKCSSFNDICLLLKSSDFIAHDLIDSYKYCQDSTLPHSVDQFELVLRQWLDLAPGMEFRVFVKQNCIVGISQRHPDSFFKYLLAQKSVLQEEIFRFFNKHIQYKFADENYVFDIVKLNNGIYQLVDFNPFGASTHPLLFSWIELEQVDPKFVNQTENSFFRVIKNSEGIQPSLNIYHALPKDFVDLSHGEDINKFIDFLNVDDLIVKQGED